MPDSRRTGDYIVGMRDKLKLQSVSDDELLRRLSELLTNSRRVEAELIAHIAEVEERRLYARYASSMFKYATECLHLSEHEAYLRIEVARASRKHPVLLEMLADGRLHLSGAAMLHGHLTEANRKTVLERATHMSKRQIEKLIAELCPKPDVPPKMRKLPERQGRAEPKPANNVQLGPDRVVSNSEAERNNPGVGRSATDQPAPPPTQTAELKPLSPARYKVVFTASAELHDKLERLQALMHSSGDEGDLASVIEAAVTEKLERLEAKRYGKTKTPRKSLEETDTSPSCRAIPAPVRRAVYERDRGRCCYVNPSGRRCTETKRLEYHHIQPYGRGGDHSPENVCLLCRTHNGYLAEQDYGKEVIDRFRSSPNRVSEPAAIYTFSNRATLAS